MANVSFQRNFQDTTPSQVKKGFCRGFESADSFFPQNIAIKRAVVLYMAVRGYTGIVAFSRRAWPNIEDPLIKPKGIFDRGGRSLWPFKPDQLPHYQLGMALYGQRKMHEPMAHSWKGVPIRPDYAEAENILGIALAQPGETEKIMDQFS